MSKMILIAVRHDKLDEVANLKVKDLNFTDSDYAQCKRESKGLIISDAHHASDGDNLFINAHGVRYVNAVSQPNKVFDDVKDKMIDTQFTGAEGVDFAQKFITKSEKVSTVGEMKLAQPTSGISLYALSQDDVKKLKKYPDIFKDLAENVKKQMEHDDLMLTGNYAMSRGTPVTRDLNFPLKYLNTLSENTSALVNLSNDIYYTFTIPNVSIDLDSKNIDKDLETSLGIKQKQERKLKMS